MNTIIEEKPAFKIDISQKQNFKTRKTTVTIKSSYSFYYKILSENRISCLVPGLNFVFAADDVEMAKEKANFMVRIFLEDNFIGQQPILNLTSHLKSIGFKVKNNNKTFSDLFRDRPTKATLSIGADSFNVDDFDNKVDAIVKNEKELALP